MNKQVLLAANISDAFKETLLAKSYTVLPWDGLDIPKDIVGIITSNKLSLSADRLALLQNLQWIARLGSGIEIIDTDYCKTHGIAFASSPRGIANAVAEHCVAMLISLQKNISSSFQEVQQQQWIREPNRGCELEGKTIGLIGYGNTGKAFARKLSIFGVSTLAYDKYKSDYSDAYATEVSLEELQAAADIISFHIPLNAETENYYNQGFIATCKPHLILNTSRGGILNTQDLIQALEEKSVLGAALDVLDIEQDLKDPESASWEVVNALRKHQVLITPHIAGYSHNAIEKMSAELMEKLKGVI